MRANSVISHGGIMAALSVQYHVTCGLASCGLAMAARSSAGTLCSACRLTERPCTVHNKPTTYAPWKTPRLQWTSPNQVHPGRPAHCGSRREHAASGISVLWPLQCWLTKYKDTRMGDMLLMAQCVPYSAAATGPNGH